MFLLSVLGCLSLAVYSQGFLFGSKVCYGELGCFNNDKPFNNALLALPDSPEDVGTSFSLYTRKNPTQSQLLSYKDKTTIDVSNFNSKLPTKFLIHGYFSSGRYEFFVQMTKLLLEKADMNVIIVDWSKGASNVYQKCVANTRLVGVVVAKFIEFIRDNYQADPADMHLIGESLGAHISGYVGSRVKNLGRISGLDPAGPSFEGTDNLVHLDANDATFVDCIHTNGLPLYKAGLGTLESWGDVDFYPNGGSKQAGCPEPISNGFSSLFTFHFSEIQHGFVCNHHRAVQYYIESLKNTSCQMVAHPCSSYDDYEKGKCNGCGNGPCPILGYRSIESHRKGKFYLDTNTKSPFCMNTNP